MARRGESSAVEIDDNSRKKNPIYVSQVFGGLEPMDRWFCLNGDVTTGGVWRRYPGIKCKARQIDRFEELPHLGFLESLLMDGSIYLIGRSGWWVTPSPNEKEGLVVMYTELMLAVRKRQFWSFFLPEWPLRL
ncbi:hypothetical protein DM860_009792 [Cuscuta australis]|uniref:Uncharacterized protein n=1 Tax=Cuscuta australis TaxID=267555 RepID=A0A328DCQ8_9ASTE|nr:hypothetical protein DM860_009792 [Cuscuta australis]